MLFLTSQPFVLLLMLLTASPPLAVAEIKLGDILGVITLGILLLTTGLRGRERRRRMDQKQQHLEDRVGTAEANIKRVEENMIRCEKDTHDMVRSIHARLDNIQTGLTEIYKFIAKK